MLSYTYSILRYVHDTLTAEFVNIGVLTYSKELQQISFLHIQPDSQDNYPRLSAMFPDVNKYLIRMIVNTFNANVHKIRLEIKQGKQLPDSVENYLMVRDDSSIQWSPNQGTGLMKSADDFELTAENLYKRFITKFDKVIAK